MSDSYMITVPIELDTKNAREKLKAQFTSFKQDIEGELYKIRITADTKDLDKIRESLKGLKAEEIAKINIQVDRSGFDKQLLNLKNATGKSADDIGKTFKKTIQDNFESLSLDDLIQKQFDGKRYSGGRASEVVKNLYGTVTTPLPKDADFISVVRMAEAYEQLGNSLSELKQKSPREYEKLDFKESDIKNATKAFYNNIGNMMLDESVRNNFIEQINTSFQTLNENISMLMSSIIDDSKKLGDGLGGGVGQISEEVQRQVDAISTQIDDTTKKIEEMEAKLQELQTKKSKMPNFFKTITDADGNRVKLGIDDLIKQQQDEINNAKRSIEELEEKKKQLLSGSGTGGGAGTGAGSGNGTGNGNGTTTVGVEPDSTQFISKLQEQINGQYVDVDVKPKTENFVEDIKNSVSDMEPVLVPVKPDMEGFVDDIKSSISNSNIEIGVQPKIDVSQPISQPDLIGKLSSQMNEYMEKAGTSRGNGYWDQLRDSFSQLDTETKKLLNDLGLLNSEANGINTINVGANNFGGIIGNKNTLIARSNISQEYLSAADELKNKLDAAAESGVNVARILNNVYDPKNKVMFQLMETLPGTDMSTLGQDVELVNLDALQASDEQVKKLISDLKVLYDLGLGIDVESGNLLFDKLQGFSLIDLDLKPIHNSFEELVADVMRYLDDIRAHFEDAGNQSGVGFVNGFESKFKSLLKAGNELPQKTDAQLYDEAKNIGGYFSSEESTSRETSSLDSLINKLGEVTRAIDEKTQAFSQEAGVVDGVITGEVNMLDALLGEVNLIMGDLGKLADAITTLPQIELKMGEVGDDSTINTKFSETLEELKRAFANFDLSSTSGLKETIDSLKISKQNVKNLNELSDAIIKMSDAFQSLGNASSGSPEFMAIQELLQNAEALKDLAKVLQASQDQINKAKQAVGGKSTGGTSAEVDELRKYNQAVKEYYEAQARLQTGKTDKKAQDELQSANALKIIEQYEAKINEMQQKGIELSKQQTNAIKARQDAEEKLAATVKDYNDAQQKKAVDEQKKRIENTVSGIGKQIEKMWTVTTGKTPAYTDEITKLEGQYHELQTVISGIDWNGDAEAQLQDVQQSIRSLQANINDVRSGREFRVANDNKIASINRSMSEWMQRNSGAGDYLDQVRALQTELQKVGSMTDLDKVIQGFEGIKAAAADAGKTGKSFMDMLSGSFKNLAKYLLTFASFYRVIGYIKSAVNVVKELDTAMVEIRKVTTESAESLERFSRSSFNMADKYGTTAKQIQESTASWLRLGENFQQATESAQMSAYLLNTTEISSIDEATEDLVSISQAYKEISKSDIIDKLNNIGDHFSSSSSDLAQGLKNASAVLKTQGNDIDKALALLTAGNNITQDISKTSAGIRTIALRISGVCPNVQ